MTLWDVLLKEQEERENNKTKEFQRDALQQYIQDECKWDPSKKSYWRKKEQQLMAELAPDHKWKDILDKINFTKLPEGAKKAPLEFGKKFANDALKVEIDLDHPENTIIDLTLVGTGKSIDGKPKKNDGRDGKD